ncbi:Fatty acid metabolism regulator protein [Pelotomaculum schinkii]|uniref:Fatty acid metabolism regulator protein n=1 Tax=Pelotomaculum schinkii TaxID=78350 RepID=A0A4Y7RGE5_9FIRM|nr:TetR/AcrR family transcriptional regulator [Pelotomaculum schinkii]TEB07886.1 Fatty acid metabolism regulator protein [Pelotomaculum schinkii]
MAKITSRAKQAEITKNKIYECGVKLVRKHGFDQVTVEQIAKEAGVSVGTYYYYFASKYELFREIFKRADDYFVTDVAGQLKADDCKGQIVEYFEKYVDLNYADGIEMIKKLYTSENKMFLTKGRAMQTILQSIIEEWQVKAQIPKHKSAAEITRMLFIAARGVVFDWCLHDGETDLKNEMKNIISNMVDGFMFKKERC